MSGGMLPSKEYGYAPMEAARAGPPSAARGLYLLVLCAAFALDVVFLFAFVVNPIDYCLTSLEAIDYIDISFVYVRMSTAVLASFLGFTGFSLALQPLRDQRRALERSLSVLAAEVLAAATASGGFLGPASEPRRLAVRIVVAAHLLSALFATLHSLLSRRAAIDLPMSLDEVDTSPAFRKHFEDGMGRPSLERLERFLEVRSVRASIRAQLHRSNSCLAWLGGALLLLSACNFALELRRTLGSDPPLLSDLDVTSLNSPESVQSYFGDLPTQPREPAVPSKHVCLNLYELG